MKARWHSCVKSLAWLCPLVCALPFARGAPAEASGLAAQSFEVLGVTPGISTVADVERTLGPGHFRRSSNVEEGIRCYSSAGTDRTVLEFDNWLEGVVEFRFFRGSAATANRCAKSRLISNSLSTANGLRLGMTVEAVIALLGAPTSSNANRLTYKSSYDRPPTPEELAQFKGTPYNPPASINVYEKIDLRLRRGTVVRVDVMRGKD